MRGMWIKHTATGGSGNLTLSAVSGFPTFTNVFGAGARIVEYEIDDGAGSFESGIGSVASLVLTRSTPLATFTGTTYANTAVTALTFSGTVNVRCSPLVGNAAPNVGGYVINSLGDAISSAGDPMGGGYAVSNTALTTGFVAARPFIWRGRKPITSAQMYCTTLSSGAKMLAGIYEPTGADTLALRLDLSNSGNGFSGTTTGSKVLTSGGGNFTETLLPVGEYVVAFLQLTAAASWAGWNCFTAASAILGTISGLPIGKVLSGGSQTTLPASITVSTFFSGSAANGYANTCPWALNLGPG